MKNVNIWKSKDSLVKNKIDLSSRNINRSVLAISHILPFNKWRMRRFRSIMSVTKYVTNEVAKNKALYQISGGVSLYIGIDLSILGSRLLVVLDIIKETVCHIKFFVQWLYSCFKSLLIRKSENSIQYSIILIIVAFIKISNFINICNFYIELALSYPLVF